MTNTILGIVASVLACVIGLWQWQSRKAKFRREQAEKAQKDLQNAKDNDDPSSLLDAFNRVRK